MYLQCTVLKEDTGARRGGTRIDGFRDEHLKYVRLSSGGVAGVQIVTSHGSENFQKVMGSKREAICWYSVGSLRDFGHACIMSWTR